MTTFIKIKFKKSDDQTNNRVAVNITEYHIISKLIFLKIIILKFMVKSQLFHVKKSKINKFKWMYGLFGHNYRVASLSKRPNCFVRT